MDFLARFIASLIAFSLLIIIGYFIYRLVRRLFKGKDSLKPINYKMLALSIIVVSLIGSFVIFEKDDKPKQAEIPSLEELKEKKEVEIITNSEKPKKEDKTATIDDEIYEMYVFYMDRINELEINSDYTNLTLDEMVELGKQNERQALAETAEKYGMTPEEADKVMDDNITELVNRSMGKAGQLDKLEAKAKEIWGDNLRDVTYYHGYVTVTHDLKDNLTQRYIKLGFYKDIIDYLKLIKDLDYVDSLGVFAFAELTDQYGDTHDSKVLSLDLERETIDKINFDNFLRENLPNIADSYYEHPALNK